MRAIAAMLFAQFLSVIRSVVGHFREMTALLAPGLALARQAFRFSVLARSLRPPRLRANESKSHH